MKPSRLMVALLLAALTDEQMRDLAAAQARAKTCLCPPNVRDQRSPERPGLCWNCGKPLGEVRP